MFIRIYMYTCIYICICHNAVSKSKETRLTISSDLEPVLLAKISTKAVAQSHVLSKY